MILAAKIWERGREKMSNWKGIEQAGLIGMPRSEGGRKFMVVWSRVVG